MCTSQARRSRTGRRPCAPRERRTFSSPTSSCALGGGRLLRKLDGFELFIDCGGWSVFTGAVPSIAVRDYVDWIRAQRRPFKLVAALDVIGDAEASRRNYLEMRDAGLDVIPTWHAGETPELAREYAARADYLAIGGLAGRAKYGDVAECVGVAWPEVKHRQVHLFGVGAGQVVARYRPASIDCSSWLLGSRFATVFSLRSWPRLANVPLRPSTPGYRREEALAIVDEARGYGFSMRDLQRDYRVRLRYNVRTMLDYMRRINAVGRAA